MNKTRISWVLFVFLAFLATSGLQAQTDEQKELELRKNRLQKEITQINTLLSQQQRERKSVLEELEDINQKVRVRKELIKVTNQQTNLLNRQINNNLNEISDLRDELNELKDDYAEMIRKSYESNSQQSRLMFLLSSEGFLQAFKRLKYMQQYTDFRREQGLEIGKKTQKLQNLNKDLIAQRKTKETLIAENREEQNSLEKELGVQQQLISSIKKKESTYAAQIKKKQKEADAIDRQIRDLINSAIAKSNKSSGSNTKSSSFVLTAEAKLVGDSFKDNKGKLPWPVEKGVVKSRFGVHPHPVVKSVNVKSNGVTISTEKGSKVRAVFNGTVLVVSGYKGGNKMILVQHGSYISVYSNLAKVYVKEGDQVKTKQDIGEVFTNNYTQETWMKFVIYNNNKIDNPANWIYRM